MWSGFAPGQMSVLIGALFRRFHEASPVARAKKPGTDHVDHRAKENGPNQTGDSHLVMFDNRDKVHNELLVRHGQINR